MLTNLEQSIHNYIPSNLTAKLSVFPHRKLENWRHTSLKEFTELSLSPTQGNNTVQESKLGELFLQLDGQDIIHNNGIELTEIEISDEIKNLCQVNDSADYFSNLNSLSCQKILHINITEKPKSPLEILHTSSQEGSLNNSMLLITCNDGVSIEIVERYSYEHSGLSINRTIVLAKKQAKVTHLKMLEKAPNHFVTLIHEASIARDATYDVATIHTNTKLARNIANIELAESSAEAKMNGAYILKDSEHSDTFSQIHHMKSYTFSHQLFKGLLDDTSHAVFSGNIKVHPDAQKINSEQLNKNILLNNHAKVNTQPQLIISADDVKCSHGATIGKMNDEELFYLQSRGISKERAKHLLTQAFVVDILEIFKSKAIRDYANLHITNTLKDFSSLKESEE